MAKVVCFPQERNVGKARHVARLYLGKETERSRNTYWHMVCDRLARSMRRAGFSDAQIHRQTQAFLWAVEQEIARMCQRDNGPGAA
tara:strand:+ start:2592 stop:2849 length:258 start_codon:yes stop_codon:yes gene_type:complete